jgi:hypothetical protein
MLVELRGVAYELAEVFVVAFDEGLLDHDGEKRFVLAILLAASLNHLLQERSETFDILFVVGDKAFVANYLDEVAEGTKAAHHLLVVFTVAWLLFAARRLVPNLFKDGLNVIVLDETPEDLPTVHAEESLEDHFIFPWQRLIIREPVDFAVIGMPVVEILSTHLPVISVDETVDVVLQSV